MIKKVFVGILLAGLFLLLILGAVNRTYAKSIGNEPYAVGEFKKDGDGGGHKNENRNAYQEARTNGCLTDCDCECDCDSAAHRTSEENTESSYKENGNKSNGNHGAVPGAGPNDGAGPAPIEDWITLNGVVESTASDVWVITLENDTYLKLEGRVLSYIEEQNFSVTTLDLLILLGFYEGEDFKVGKIENSTSGEIIFVRDENGRPLWGFSNHSGGNE